MTRHGYPVIALFCSILFGAACSERSPAGPTALGPGGDLASASEAASRTTVALHPFPVGPDLPGTSSSLVRTDSGVSMTIHTNGLVSGNAYTVWFVIFNTPADCVDDGCGVDDVFANRGTPSLRLAAGHVGGASGLGNFGGHLSVGDTGGPACSSDPSTLGSCGPGLLDARAAEIHLVVRSHGPAIPDLTSEQISSFLGGCSVNACANIQAAVHQPLD
jgi:hypothetical protein